MRLWLGVLVAVGVVSGVWLIGHLGYRLGFAPLVLAPDLVGDPGGGLATGTLVLISIPRAVFQAGLSQPMWLMLGFAMIAGPAAGLGAARPLTPGGPRPKTGVMAIASAGAVLSMVSGAAILWWTGCSARGSMLRPLPVEPAASAAWLVDLRTVAGLDVLAVVGAALWVVLVLRLPIPIWLRSIAASAAFFTLVVATVAMSISNVAATEVGAARAVCRVDDGAGSPRVLLGATPHHLATLGIANGHVMVELRSHPESITVNGRQSIVEFLAEGTEGQRD
jgi:hypothetical protein